MGLLRSVPHPLETAMRRFEIGHANAGNADPLARLQVLELAVVGLHLLRPLERTLGEALDPLLKALLHLSASFDFGDQLSLTGVQLGGLGVALGHEVPVRESARAAPVVGYHLRL